MLFAKSTMTLVVLLNVMVLLPCLGCMPEGNGHKPPAEQGAGNICAGHGIICNSPLRNRLENAKDHQQFAFAMFIMASTQGHKIICSSDAFVSLEVAGEQPPDAAEG